MLRLKKLVIIIIVFISFLSLGEIVLCNSLSDKGQEVENLEEEIKSLEEENQRLEAQVAQEASLVKVREKVKELGFQKPRVFYLKSDAEIAFEY